MSTRVKICCIKSVAEARLAIELGADALGLVAEMPSGPGPLLDAVVADIATSVPPGIDTFLLTSRATTESIIRHVQKCRASVVQLVDDVPEGAYRAIRMACPNVRIVQVIHVEDQRSVAAALRAAECVDAILLDSGRPTAAVKELGGTGRTHDWQISAQIVQQSPVPVYLAGGLNADNVRSAIQEVAPFGVDLCSGVRTNDALDRVKLSSFMQAVRVKV